MSPGKEDMNKTEMKGVMTAYEADKEIVIRRKAPWLSADQHSALLFSFINGQGWKLVGFTAHTRQADDGNRLAGLGSEGEMREKITVP